MLQEAVVTKLLPEDRAEVSVVRASACGKNCSSCEGCAFQNELKVVADNPIKANPGTKVQIESSILIAPCDGTIVQSTAAEGGFTMADIGLFRLAEDANLYISTDYVTSEQIDKALEIYGTVAGKSVDVEYVPMDRVEYISRNDSGEDMYSTFIVSDSAEAEVESGMNAVIFIVTERDDNALIVPTCALRRDINGDFVYIVDANGTQIRRNVKRGIYNDAYVQILEGIEEGDVVYAGN